MTVPPSEPDPGPSPEKERRFGRRISNAFRRKTGRTGEPDEDDGWDHAWDAPRGRRFGLDARSAQAIVMGAAAAVVVIAVIIAVIVVGVGSHGGSAAAPTPTGTQRGTAAAGSGVTCADVGRDSTMAGRFSVTAGGSVPTGAPLPGPAPAHVCTAEPLKGAQSPVTVLIFPDVSLASYEQTLADQGWLAQQAGPVEDYTNPASPYEIALFEVNGALVALYHE